MQNQLYNFILREIKMNTSLSTIYSLEIFLKKNTYKYSKFKHKRTCYLGVFSIIRRDCHCLLTKKIIFNTESSCNCCFFKPINDTAVR